MCSTLQLRRSELYARVHIKLTGTIRARVQPHRAIHDIVIHCYLELHEESYAHKAEYLGGQRDEEENSLSHDPVRHDALNLPFATTVLLHCIYNVLAREENELLAAEVVSFC